MYSHVMMLPRQGGSSESLEYFVLSEYHRNISDTQPHYGDSYRSLWEIAENGVALHKTAELWTTKVLVKAMWF
jgi:hypothetical protein